METMTQACGDHKTDQTLSFLPLSPQPLPPTSQHLYPSEIRSKGMSRANWQRVSCKPGPRDRSDQTESEGGVTTWLALGNLGPRAPLVSTRWQSRPPPSAGILTHALPCTRRPLSAKRSSYS